MLDKDLLRRRVAFLRLGGETQRWHTKRTLQVDTVGHHTYNVASLVLLMSMHLDMDRRGFLMIATVVHDTPEHKSGDMPGDAKREMGVRDTVNAYDTAALEDIGMNFEAHLTPEEARILKVADMMDGCFFCIGEASLGNRRMEHPFSNFRKYLSLLEPSGPVETAIVEYIDELWARYGEE